MRHSADLWIATFLFVCASAVSVVAYGALLGDEKPTRIPLNFFEDGENNLCVLHDNRSVGNFQSNISSNKATFFSIQGAIRTSYLQEQLETEMILSGYFNPLGQLSESQLKVHSDVLELLVRTENISPVSVMIDAKIAGKKFNYSFTTTGPLLLVQEKGSYFLELHNRTASNSNYMSTIAQNMFSDLHLDVVKTKPPTPACEGKPAAWIDLNPWARHLNQINIERGEP